MESISIYGDYNEVITHSIVYTSLTAVFIDVIAGWTLNCSMHKSSNTDCVNEQSDIEVATPKMRTIGRSGRCGLVKIIIWCNTTKVVSCSME